ncbi:hypothetical protein M513_12418 [Trichuris suis]|uniref:Retrotransposon gag domain-containing protein n=1 Tax=Trichuris suis TaxID=68888 RepID=A0A085LP12_9BILA|nr:hypothetical protein M513_12418 [Trichuris suis]
MQEKTMYSTTFCTTAPTMLFGLARLPFFFARASYLRQFETLEKDDKDRVDKPYVSRWDFETALLWRQTAGPELSVGFARRIALARITLSDWSWSTKQAITYNCLSLKFARRPATLTALEQLFTPKSTVCEERQSLRKRYQFPEEPVDRYVAALRETAPNCAFGPLENEMVRDQLIEGISSEGIRERLPSVPDLTLEKALIASQQMEIAKKDAGLFSTQDLTAAVQSTESTSFSSFRGTGDLLPPTPPCFRCGRDSHFATCSNCQAKHARCRKRDKLRSVYPSGPLVRMR